MRSFKSIINAFKRRIEEDKEQVMEQRIEKIHAPVKEKLPKGTKRYWVSPVAQISLQQTTPDDFSCIAINEKNAKRKYENWLRATSGAS